MLRYPKKGRKNSGGGVDVNFDKPDIHKLFSEAQGIIHMVNSVMMTLLKRLSLEEENGLLPFYREFASKEELKHELELFLTKSSKHPIKKQ